MTELYGEYYGNIGISKKYANILSHIDLYGREGALFYSELATKTLPKFFPKTIQYPIYLRNSTSDIPTLYQVFYDLEYDIDYPFDPKIIVDCGANIGLSAVYFKNRFPKSKIIAIEPEQSNFDFLKKNTNFYEDIHILKRGIWNKNTNLKVENIGLGHWGFVTTEVDENTPDSIKGITIDSIMNCYDLDHIDILKIDIEGSEKELFESNYEKWIDKVNCIIIELHDRFKNGCEEAFNKTIENYDFSVENIGENIILFKN